MGHHPVEDSNRSGNRPFDDIVKTRLSRRRLLTGTASAATVGVLGSDRLRRKQQFRHIYNSIYRSYNEPRATRL